MIETILLIFAAEAGPVAATEAVIAEPNPKTMSQKEIRAFNSQLPRNHPYYIRCVSEEETGSLARKTYSCRTNQQWELAGRIGNQNARETYDAMTSKAANSN